MWWATDIECTSAIARLEREKQLGAPLVDEAVARLSVLAKAWNEVQPTDAVRRTAKRLLRTHPLRAADALQLAAALAASEGDAGSVEFVSLDERLNDAARREGMRVAEL